jgi:hypothetical protein
MARAICLAALLALLSGFGALSQPAPPPPEASTEQQQAGAENQKQPQSAIDEILAVGKDWLRPVVRFFSKHHNFWVAIGTIVIAAFTVILGVATWLLSGATRDLVEGADKNAERQLRAYVLAFQARLTNFESDAPTVEVVIKNSGQTPAYRVTGLTLISFRPYPLGKPLTLSQDATKKNCGVLGPQATFSIITRLDHPPLPPEQKARVRDKKAAVYAHGRIEYTDAFDEPRWATYQYIYGGEEDPHPDGDMALCDEGNDAN